MSRQGVGLLAGVGMDEFVAANCEDLVAKAVGWASNTAQLAGRVSGLRERFQASPQMDHASYTHDLEAALLEMVTA